MSIVRSNRDDAILEALVLKVRVLSQEMISQAWWSESATPSVHAGRRLEQLTNADLLERTDVLAEPLLPLEAPICSWKPGETDPDFEAVGYALQSRWTEPPQHTPVFVATTKSVNQYGGRGRGGLQHRLQATHDLHLAAVYLRYLRLDPDSATRWVGEDLLGQAGFRIKDPDAIVLGSDGKPDWVVEFGGRYDARRVKEFHEHCERFALRYELW